MKSWFLCKRTVFDIAPPGKKEKIHQAEKPVELMEQILRFVTKEDELVLDQFAGSGVLGEAALRTHRDSILIEKDEETFRKLTERLQVLGDIQTVTSAQRDIIAIGSDALVAKDAYFRTGDEKQTSACLKITLENGVAAERAATWLREKQYIAEVLRLERCATGYVQLYCRLKPMDPQQRLELMTQLSRLEGIEVVVTQPEEDAS